MSIGNLIQLFIDHLRVFKSSYLTKEMLPDSQKNKCNLTYW